ncbi:MAG TPA: hypothetical protein VNK41_05600 [Vicinamibacterales bacterium]|nr:hypothetical protein [Vicinamibacterales bacterium]
MRAGARWLREGTRQLTRFIGSMRFGVRPADPLTFVLSALLRERQLVACWIPARRAAAVDPIAVLRAE